MTDAAVAQVKTKGHRAKYFGAMMMRFSAWCAAIILCFVILTQILLWGGIAWLNSSYGQNALQSVIGQSLSSENEEMTVKIGGFSFLFPSRMRIGKITAYKNDHPYIDIENMNLQIGIFPFENEEVSISLQAGKVTLHEHDAGNAGGALPFPIIIPPVEIPDLPFKRVVIDTISAGNITLAQSGASLSPVITGEIERIDEQKISVQINYKNENEYVDIQGEYDALNAYLNVTEMSVKTGVVSAVATAKMEFREGGELSVDASVQSTGIKNLSPVSVNITAKNTQNFTSTLKLKTSYEGTDIAASANIQAPKDEVLINGLSVILPEINIHGNVGVNLNTLIASGHVSGSVKSLAPYTELIGSDHNIKNVTFDLTLSGQDLVQKTRFNVNAARYKHLPSGIQIRDISATGQVNGNEIQFSSIKAHDDKDGVLEGHGSLDMATHDLDMSVSAKNMHINWNDTLDTSLSAEIRLNGEREAYHLKGDIHSDKIDIKLPERVAIDIPALNVIDTANPQKLSETQNYSALKSISLDIHLNAPSKIFVRGWGLDSEFGGDIKIKGRADKPKFDGKFEVIRGKYSEFGKDFELKRGKLLFAGEVPPFPKLDILTETQTEDILARVHIKGSPANPNIQFSSDPALPEDEVLSHILFGKDMDKITPFQAVKLTQALQRFSGNGGAGVSSLDPLDMLRSATGLDSLSAEIGDDGSASVGAGKYLADGVYLELETGSAENSGRANIEIELTPNITVESEVGQDAQGGAGVFWKYDY